MDAQPLVRITHGDPGPEEVAAVVAVLLTRLRPPAVAPAAPVSEWARSARPGRPTAHRGPGAWRAAALPR